MPRVPEPNGVQTAPATVPALPPPPKSSGRYDFELPEHLTVSDMLAIQLADCVRIVQTLSNQATDPFLHDTERLHTIHSLENVVNASATLTQSIGRLQSESWGEDDYTPSAHAKRRKS